MAYATYTTEALVCGTFNRNTADRSYLLFTREAGMLYADARSVREERSRQRYALQDFSLIRVSLIKGKRGWKIGSIESRNNFYHQAVDKEARGSVVAIFRQLRRFVKGEEPASDVFDYLRTALETVIKDLENRSFVQLVVQVQLLSFLGYVDDKIIPSELKGLAPEEIAAQHSATFEKKIGALYTHAIAVSHL